MNICVFMGNLGFDPDVRETSNGTQVANLRVAVSEKWKDQAGQLQERTTWLRVAVFGPQVEFVRNAQKGWRCSVVGRLQERQWTDKNGVERNSYEIVVGGSGATRIDVYPSQRSSTTQAPQHSTVARPTVQRPVHQDDLDDEVPW